MRRPYHVSPSNPTQRVNLPFYADSVTVLNPTQYAVYFRSGGSDAPGSVASADFWVPPYSTLTFPVSSNMFVVQLGTALLPVPAVNSTYPTDVTVLFTAMEQVPQYGGYNIGGISPGAIVVKDQANRITPPNTNADTVPLFPGVRTLSMTFGRDVTAASVIGSQSGYTYFLNQSLSFAGASLVQRAVFLVDTERDTSVLVSVTSLDPTPPPVRQTANNYTMLGYQERMVPGLWDVDGRQRVDVLPLGGSSLPVAVQGSVAISSLPFAPLNPFFTAAVGPVANPVANALILTTGAIPTAGWYDFNVIVGLVGSATFQLQHVNAAQTVALMNLNIPTPPTGPYRFRRFIALNERVSVFNGPSALMGSISAHIDWEMRQ